MLLQIQKYDIDVKYKRGKDLVIADALSRAYINDKQNIDFDNEISSHVCMVISEINITKRKWKEFQEHTKADNELQLLKKTIVDGWPKSKKYYKA
ncbi:hypothetical protein QE152_g34422 [Popillia japonica]|uniref:Uncharacterized protein n=1 Tax=Popillia japonica TaxID=7064 RepID=A0AAW1IT48_POPJA